MTDYLVFRLYAPMASWGAPAVGETRPSQEYPTRSAIVGLLAAALGVKRDDFEGQQALSNSIEVAVKQYSAGSLLRDYHTTQVPGTRSKVHYSTRKEELSAPQKVLNTILSTREYRSDGLWVIALRLANGAAYSFEQLRCALEKPHFVLYLGRKSCPVAAPLGPRIVQAGTLKEALDTSFAIEPEQRELLPFCGDTAQEQKIIRDNGQRLYSWEGSAMDLSGELSGVESSDVWDTPLDRQKWQFAVRTEYRYYEQEES